MNCPQCGSRTEVNEKRGAFRDRRCTNADCALDFTTCETIMAQREKSRQCARTRHTRPGAARRTPAARVEKAIASGPARATPSNPPGAAQEMLPFLPAGDGE